MGTAMTLETFDLEIRAVSPAFLGGASQAGEWRTPPFKQLLRHWWRISRAASLDFEVAKLRAREAELFGTARDETKESRQSELRMRLLSWRRGGLEAAPDIGKVRIGENRLPGSLYAAYGPVEAGGRGQPPRLKSGVALQAGDGATLRIAAPGGSGIGAALRLIQRFGAVGGRNRNGWGSVDLEGNLPETVTPLVDWQRAMERDWAHGIGRDGQGPLIWHSAHLPRWEDAMRLLAQTRADMRRNVPNRLALAYPDTKGRMPGWSGSDRVPHSLRCKVRRDGDAFSAVVFHAPCRPSDALWSKLSDRDKRQFPETFEAAHRFLDSKPEFARSKE